MHSKNEKHKLLNILKQTRTHIHAYIHIHTHTDAAEVVRGSEPNIHSNKNSHSQYDRGARPRSQISIYAVYLLLPFYHIFLLPIISFFLHSSCALIFLLRFRVCMYSCSLAFTNFLLFVCTYIVGPHTDYSLFFFHSLFVRSFVFFSSAFFANFFVFVKVKAQLTSNLIRGIIARFSSFLRFSLAILVAEVSGEIYGRLFRFWLDISETMVKQY